MKLLSSDWHLTDREVDAYRWRIFEFLRTVLDREPNVDDLYVLGDVTDKRDNHSAGLVNRLIKELNSIHLEHKLNIYILGGNHDRPYAGPAYFEFLDQVDGLHYVSRPTCQDGVWMLPFTSTPDSDWSGYPLGEAKAILIHQAIEGAVAANGFRVEPDCRVLLPRGKKIFSGHIHKPQVVSGVTYVGAPFHTAFGDEFEPRVLLWRDKEVRSIETGLTQKPVLHFTDMENLDANPRLATIHPGDHVRLCYTGKSHDLRTVEAKARESLPPAERVEFVALPVGEGTLFAPVQPETPSTADPEETLRVYFQRRGREKDVDLAVKVLKGATDLDEETIAQLNRLEALPVLRGS